MITSVYNDDKDDDFVYTATSIVSVRQDNSHSRQEQPY